MAKSTITLCLLLVICCFTKLASANEVYSPNKKTHLSFWLDESGRPNYKITSNEKSLISSSLMGLEAKNGVNLNTGFTVDRTLYTKKDIIWHQPWGENKTIREHYNEIAVVLKNASDTRLTIRFRLFDDGLGFRYEYAVPRVDSILVTNEVTEFSIADDGVSWYTPASFDTYEMLYKIKPINEMKDASTPVTFKTNSGVYASIHEAALYDFPEMTIVNIGGRKFKSDLAPWPDGVKAKKGNSFNTSWRTIQIGEKAVDLINSSLI